MVTVELAFILAFVFVLVKSVNPLVPSGRDIDHFCYCTLLGYS